MVAPLPRVLARASARRQAGAEVWRRLLGAQTRLCHGKPSLSRRTIGIIMDAYRTGIRGEVVKGIVGIAPWAVVVALGGGAIWWMLSSDMPAGRWLLAAVLVGHGVVHLMFGIPAPAPTANGPAWPFDMRRSWAVRAGLDLRLVRSIGVALIAVVVAGFALAALSTVGVLVPSGWWQPTVAVSAVASAAVLALFFEPQLVLGHGIDVALLGVLATGAWVP